jgi:hypothetical protein
MEISLVSRDFFAGLFKLIPAGTRQSKQKIKADLLMSVL